MLPGNDMYERVELYFNGRNLKDLDFFSKSDPCLRLSFQENPSTVLKEIGRTETVANNVNPDWKKSFQLNYIFEARQEIKLEVYDDDGSDMEFIGRVFTTLGALVGARNQTSVLTLKDMQDKKETGKVIVRVEKVYESSSALMMKWSGVKLMNTDSFFDFWDKSDPYLKFLKIRQDNSTILAGQTEVIKENLSPSWNPIIIPLSKLVSTTEPRFKIECWDEEKDPSKHQFIGECYGSIQEFSALQLPAEIIMKNPKEKKPGKLRLERFQVQTLPNFVDYLRGGLQLNLIVAVDFTGSNGVPTAQGSLHYMNPTQFNQYQLALKGVWDILSNYDSDQRIPAFGFGAKPHFNGGLTSNVVNHCFPLSGNPGSIEIVGFQNLMDTYKRAVMSCEFAGPTYFAPLIKETLQFANACKMEGSNTYQILLILTDGEIHDMQATVDLIVSAAGLPLSIIIVGVGNADFNNMNTLDGDNGLTDGKGQRCPRDIVQFVPFRDVGINSASLAQELLKYLPNQVVQYMNVIGKPPNPPQTIDINKLVAPKIAAEVGLVGHILGAK